MCSAYLVIPTTFSTTINNHPRILVIFDNEFFLAFSLENVCKKTEPDNNTEETRMSKFQRETKKSPRNKELRHAAGRKVIIINMNRGYQQKIPSTSTFVHVYHKTMHPVGLTKGFFQGLKIPIFFYAKRRVAVINDQQEPRPRFATF